MQKHIIYSNGTSSIDLATDPECRSIDIRGLSIYTSINDISAAGFDGSIYVSDQVEKRSISINIVFLGSNDCEAVIHRLYSIFRIKKEGVLQYSSQNRDLKIKCRVVSAECLHNSMPLMMQVQLECGDPYFYSDEVTYYMAHTIGKLEFPFELNGLFEVGQIDNNLVSIANNAGELPTGCIFTLRANGNVNDPKIFNLQTREWMQIRVSMVRGDIIIINTQLGQKSITLVQNNKTTNYINKKYYGSTFLQLEVGDNIFAYSASTGINNLEMQCTYTPKYGGV